MTKLSATEAQDHLAGLQGWRVDGDTLTKDFDRGDFAGSVRFTEKLLGPAEEMNHHPDLEISWSRVTVRLSTHSEGGLTTRDFELAGRIDQIED